FPHPPPPLLFPYTTLFRSPLLPPEVARCGSRPVRLLARAARDQDALAPDAEALRQRDGRRGVARAARRCRARLLSGTADASRPRSEEHTSELQSLRHLVCR